MKFKKIISHLGWDGAFYILASLFAIGISLLDFTPFITLSADTLLRILLTGVGILLGAVVAQTVRRTAEINDLREAIGLMEVELLAHKDAFPNHIAPRLRNTREFVLYTFLNREIKPAWDEGGKEYQSILNERLKKHTLQFKRVDMIFNRDQLQNLVRQILKHEREDVYFRYYERPSKSIPTLNIISLDDEHFYIGGFDTTGDVPTKGQGIYIQHPVVARYLHDYWNMLWLKAIPLNEGKVINWNELQRIAKRVGLSKDEFSQMVEKLKSRKG